MIYAVTKFNIYFLILKFIIINVSNNYLNIKFNYLKIIIFYFLIKIF